MLRGFFFLTVLAAGFGGCALKPPSVPFNRPTVYQNYLAVVNGASSSFSFCVADTQETYQGPTIGREYPMCVRYREDRLYSLDSSGNCLKIFNARDPYETPRTVPFPVGSNPYDIAWGPNNQAYVSCFSSNVIYRVDLLNGNLSAAVTAPPDQGSNPEGLRVSHNKLYVAFTAFGSGSTVGIIDLASFTFTASSPLTVGENPQSILDVHGTLHVICSSGYVGWNSKMEGKIFLIDPETDLVDDDFIDLKGADPAFGVLAENGRVFVIGSSAGLLAYHPVSRQILRGPDHPIARPSNGWLMGIDSNGPSVWSCWFKPDGELLEYDTDEFGFRRSFPVGSSPCALAYVP
jgi:hypothetical protein